MKTSALSYGFLGAFLVTLFLLQWWPVIPMWIFYFFCGIFVLSILIAFLSHSRGRGTCLPAGRRPLLFIQWKGSAHSWARAPIFAAISLGMLIALLSAMRTVHIAGPHDIETFSTGQSATLHGWIIEPPDIRPTVAKYAIAVDQLVDEAGSHDMKGRVLVNDLPGWPPLAYGDEVTVRGRPTVPEKIEDFDYPHYLELRGIRAVISRGQVRAANEGRAPTIWINPVIRALSAWRTTVEDSIGLLLPEPHASLLAGLLTGSRRGLPEHLTEDFRHAGITHIIAVSGYNVTILLAILGSFLFWIPVKRRLLPLALAAIAFAIFTGASAPVVRAAIMGILGLLALSAERISTPRLSILWTAFIMLLWSPLLLWYDASFQLSFAAVIGITELSPWMLKVFKRVPSVLAIRESLTATVAAEIATLPIALLIFRQFSVIAPVTNILVAPLIPPAMLMGAVSILLGAIWTPLGLLTAYYTWAILQLIIWIAKICASVPFAAITF